MLTFLGALTTFIPVLGPLIEGAVSIYKNKTDTDIKKIQMSNDLEVQEMTASNQVLSMFASDSMVRACRDMIMVPGSIYCGAIIWDRFMDIRHPDWVWGVLPLQGAMEYLPHILLLFFFGSAALMYRNRK